MGSQETWREIFMALAVVLVASCLATVYALVFDYGLKPLIRRVGRRLRLR